MKYILFVLGILCWIAFAYDIENDRDFMTWMWFLMSQYLFVNSYIRYKHDIDIEREQLEDNIEEASIKEIPELKHIINDVTTVRNIAINFAKSDSIRNYWYQKFIEESK